MRFVLASAVSVLGITPLAAQSTGPIVPAQGAVTGFARDWRNGSPARFASIEVQDVPGARGTTWRRIADVDSTGRFRILLSAGSYLIRARSFGDTGGAGVPLFVGASDSVTVVIFTVPRGFNLAVRDMQLVQLAANRARWDSSAVRSYTAEVSLECFCLGRGSGAVVVRDGKEVQPAEVSGRGRQNLALTIDKVFDMLDGMIREPTRTTDVQYDPTFGFPVSIHSDTRLGWTDQDMRVQVRNLKRTP